MLNHSPKGYKGVTSVYTRGALIYERRRALTAWARLLALLVEGGAVWQAVAKHLRPRTEADAARTIELRAALQSDGATWTRYLAKVAGGASKVARAA